MSDLKLATQEYVDSHQSGGLKGEYTYENYHSVFTVGPGTELKLSGALTINDGYGDGESKLYDNTLKLSCSEAGMVESTIDISANISALEPIAEIRLSNQMDTSNKRVNFKFINGGDTVWGLNDWDGSLYVNGPVQFNGTITDKYGNEVTGGGGGGDISNIAWIDVNDRVIGDKEHGYVQFRGNSGVYLKYGNETIVSGESFTGITLGGRNGVYDTHIVSPSSLYINPSQLSNPSVGINIGADSRSVYINGPIKFNDSIFDKEGNEITGGGGGGGVSDLIHTEAWDANAYVLIVGNNQNSTFITGPYIGIGGSDTEFGIHIPSANSKSDVYLGGSFNNTIFISGPTVIQIEGVRLDLNGAKLNKLKTWLESNS